MLRHNCVVVPSFGGFVAKQTSAVLDASTGTMLPPRKSLLFNKQLINNDGLLIASFAKETGKSYDEAAEEIHQQVQNWHISLHAGERITIDKVGYLFLDQEKNVGFEQDRYFNLLLQSYGLGKVHFITEEDIQIVSKPAPAEKVAEKTEIRINPFEKAVPQAAEAPIIELIPEEGIEIPQYEESKTRIVPVPAKRSTTKIWRYAAAAALIPIAFYSYWIPMETKVLESGVFAFSDFNPFHQENPGTYKRKELTFKLDAAKPKTVSVRDEVSGLSEDVAVWSYPFDENLYMPVHIREKTNAEAVQTPDVQAETTAVRVEKISAPAEKASTAAKGNYHLIANCFGSAENAGKFVSHLKSKGFDAYVVDINKGLHRVSAGNADNSAALQSTQEKLDAIDVSGSWVLKK